MSELNLWQTLLAKTTEASGKSSKRGAVLVACGDPKVGKHTLLQQFHNRSAASSAYHQSNANESLIDFSYFDGDETDDDVGRVNVWHCNDAVLGERFLPQLLSRSSTQASCLWDRTAFMVCIDLSKPHSCVQSLASWLRCLERIRASVAAGVSETVLQQMSHNISQHVQLYVPPNSKSGSSGVHADEKALFQIDPARPHTNLGVPIIVVGCKADLLVKQHSAAAGSSNGAGDKFELLARQLRFICLEYGASLFYASTSASTAKAPPPAVQQYIWHRMFNTPFVFAPTFFISDANDEDNEALLIPSGADSDTLIDSTSSSVGAAREEFRGHRLMTLLTSEGSGSNEASSETSKAFSDFAPMHSVFPVPTAQGAAADPEIRAEEDQSFLRALKFLVDKEGDSVKLPRAASSTVAATRPTTIAAAATKIDLKPRSTVGTTSATVSPSASASTSPRAEPKSDAPRPSVTTGRNVQNAVVKDFFQSLLAQPAAKAPASSAAGTDSASLRESALHALQQIKRDATPKKK